MIATFALLQDAKIPYRCLCITWKLWWSWLPGKLNKNSNNDDDNHNDNDNDNDNNNNNNNNNHNNHNHNHNHNHTTTTTTAATTTTTTATTTTREDMIIYFGGLPSTNSKLIHDFNRNMSWSDMIYFMKWVSGNQPRAKPSRLVIRETFLSKSGSKIVESTLPLRPRFAATGGTPVNWRVPFSTLEWLMWAGSHVSHLHVLSAVWEHERAPGL